MMRESVYEYPGPNRVCHNGHVYYHADVMRETYDLPDLADRDRTVRDLDEQQRVLVSGGSMGGLFTALAMRQAGYEVDVYEKTERGKMKGRGAGIIAHPEMLSYLQAQGVSDWDDIATYTVRIEHLNRDGIPIDTEGEAVYTTSWNTVYQKLRAMIPDDSYHMGEEVIGVEQGDGTVTIRFDSGGEATGDLFVAADGYRSSIRDQFLPTYEPEYANYVAYRGMVPESELPPELAERFGTIYTIYHAPESQFLAYPVPEGESVERGERSINWVWYYPFEEGEELDELLLDNEGNQRSHSLPPGYMRESVRKNQIDIARDILPEKLSWLVEHTPEPFVQCIYDVAVPEMAFDRTCIIGDAAFFIRPHMASGTAHAAADALTLAELMYNRDSLDAALREWETSQIEMGHELVEEARRRGDRYTGQF
jgi:2-polyprenyl-6-methoxyphenol hydroxylase-like FAD-dependent oxidoreductase